jgi:hypothetical protein
LEEPAGLADGEAKWEFRLGPGEILLAKEIVGEGLDSEIEDEFAIFRIARAAAEREFRRHKVLQTRFRASRE